MRREPSWMGLGPPPPCEDTARRQPSAHGKWAPIRAQFFWHPELGLLATGTAVSSMLLLYVSRPVYGPLQQQLEWLKTLF